MKFIQFQYLLSCALRTHSPGMQAAMDAIALEATGLRACDLDAAALAMSISGLSMHDDSMHAASSAGSIVLSDDPEQGPPSSLASDDAAPIAMALILWRGLWVTASQQQGI